MNDDERVRWARALTTAGWLFVLAYLTYLVGQIRRAFAITTASFEDGIWGQRVEQVSFATLPQNVIIAVPAAIAAVAATLLVRDLVDRREIWLAQLVRIVAGLGYMIIGLAVLGIVGLLFRNPDGVGDFVQFLGRIGGIMLGAAMIRVCLEAERLG
ncbi:MAG: hypothetical protein QNJ12_10495 [Ilumatobacter sp.]|uniref:hypothetical protein n=1 Tax=Ilumatobacter sp. TaxID=1967498 RepID=UPI00262522B8|nr:hypothetical protein [Ilumatobacter sp.]MDJ0769216.1 hypothetical protein [Ilumatobacter sp.]